MMLKPMVKIFPCLLVASAAVAMPPKAHFISAMQMAIQEGSPELLMRSQRLVMEQIQQSFAAFPEIREKKLEVRTNGNEVVLVVTNDADLRPPFQAAITHAIEHLNGRVRARGRSMFYRTSFAEPSNGFLEVVMNETRSKIVSISAQSVPLRDLLKEIKQQTNGSLSYLIPGECADKLVDWSFNEEGRGIPKETESVLSDIATLFGMKLENKNNTYIFTGACADIPAKRHPSAELTMQRFFDPSVQAVPISARQVFVPLSPLGE